jgi:hypothetical protein
MVDVNVTVKFRINNAYDKDDLKEYWDDPEWLISWLIKEEGLFGLVEGPGELLTVEEVEE